MKSTTRSNSTQSLKSLQDLARHLRAAPLARPTLARTATQPDPAAPVPSAADRALFRAAAAGTQPLQQPAQPPGLRPNPPKAFPLQLARDERAVLREAMSDALDLDHLLETDATLSWRRQGIGVDTLRKLRRGHWTIQNEIDLHGLRSDQAREALGQFLRTAVRRGWRCVRVIHGKGLSSPQREPVLKPKVLSWLIQREEVMAYVQARPCDGGAGALVLLLRSARRGER